MNLAYDLVRILGSRLLVTILVRILGRGIWDSILVRIFGDPGNKFVKKLRFLNIN